MGQQLHIRYKRQRRVSWIKRKKADKAKSKPVVAKTENTAKPAELKTGN